MDIPPQAAYLYSGKWYPDVDTIVLDTMIKLKAETNWRLHDFPYWFLMTAAFEVQSKMAITFSEAEISHRMEFMKLRYDTFRSVQKYNGVIWDMQSQCIVAGDEMWATILKKSSFAGAYYHRDDPHYSKIACLFGLEDVKTEEDTQVIVISDKTEKLSSGEPSCYVVGEYNEEVNSPAVFPPRIVRRKLFPEVGNTTDRESSTSPGINFIDLASDDTMRTKVKKGRALPKPPVVKNAEGPKHAISPHAYSCGSNSPNDWWMNLPK